MNNTQMPRNGDPRNNEEMPPTANETPLLVTLSARAIGSLGLGLSVLVIWFRWLVPPTIPTSVPAIPVTNALRTRRRRSVPPPFSLIPPVRRAIVPTPPKPSSPPEEDVALHRSRHVYFLDSTLPNARFESSPRETGSSEQVPEEGESLNQPPAERQSSADGSPRSSLSSSSTLVSNSTHVQMNVDPSDEPVVDSDSSSRRSLSKRLPKMKNPFVGKARRRSSNGETVSKHSASLTDSDDAKTASVSGHSPAARRSVDEEVMEVISPKPSRRPFGCPNLKPATVSPSTLGRPSDPASPSTSCFSRRKSRRHSSTAVPIPRTLPYEAPYFATPPIPFNASYSPNPKRLPSGNDTSLGSSLRSGSKGGQENNYSPRRQSNDAAQAALGLRRPESTAKRRSASDNLAHSRRAPTTTE